MSTPARAATPLPARHPLAEPSPGPGPRPGDCSGDALSRAGGLSGMWRVFWCAIWLVFLAYPIGDIVSGRYSTARAALGWATLALFVALYLRTMWMALGVDPRARQRPQLAWLVALIVFSLTSVLFFGGQWGGVIIYLGVATGATLRGRAAIATLAVIAAAGAGAGLVNHVGVADVAFASFLSSALGVSMMGVRRMIQLIVDLDDARQEVARLTASEERLRFARDLHDVLGHSLSVIALKSQVARRLMGSDRPGAEAAITDVETVARQSLRDVRELVSGYRQRSLAEELLGAREVLAAAGVALQVDNQAGTPAPEVDGLLAWVVREGTTNLLRHSRARQGTIRIVPDAASTCLEITDDGTGGTEPSAAGSGLDGLRERMEAAGGSLDAGPRQPHGFRLAVRIPTGQA